MAGGCGIEVALKLYKGVIMFKKRDRCRGIRANLVVVWIRLALYTQLIYVDRA